MVDTLGRVFTRLGVLAAHPGAFFLLFIYGSLWLLTDPASFDWHAGAVLATWMMTLFIQRATHRDTQALQGKLDELLRVDSEARSEIAELDKEEPEEIEERRERDGAES
jgi:low affinity Fe/Cu permease